jgi:hypothetical protein
MRFVGMGLVGVPVIVRVLMRRMGVLVLVIMIMVSMHGHRQRLMAVRMRMNRAMVVCVRMFVPMVVVSRRMTAH